MGNLNANGVSDSLGRYYTCNAVGELLVEAMAVDSPKLVLDLGAGDGALTDAAANVWGDARYFTVDIDGNASSATLPIRRGMAFKHYVGDALASSIHKQIGLDFGSADAAICNPPYIRPKWQKHFGEIIDHAGLSSVLPKMSDVTADLLFIAQNLRFLKPDGHLGLILPDGFIAGEKFKAIRRHLANEHCIKRIIELPRRIFRKTDAKAHIVVLAKQSQDVAEICVQRLEKDGSLSRKIFLPKELAANRLDYSYLEGTRYELPIGSMRIRDVTTLLVRGKVSSSQRAKLSYPVLHTTDFVVDSKSSPARFSLRNEVVETLEGTVAKVGDILVARVGRNLNQKICMVHHGKVVLSDSVFLLRVDPVYRSVVFSYLRSDAGRYALGAASHGVGACFLTSEALLNMSFYDNK